GRLGEDEILQQPAQARARVARRLGRRCGGIFLALLATCHARVLLRGRPRRDRSGAGVPPCHARRGASESGRMIEVHHLNQSRSHRVIWMLEELGVPYELVRYERLPSMMAPPELKAIHPLGKSPVIRDGELTLAESGAILEYLIERYGDGQLAP